MKSFLFVTLIAVLCMINNVASHSYHLGSCPTVEPMSDFDMDRFLGKWYVIEKTSTGSKCLTYNFSRINEPGVNFTSSDEEGEYKIEQVSEHPILGLVNVDNKYHYTGILTIPDIDVPSKMTVRFPLSVAGTASYTVLGTDYDTYGAIFTCQKLAFANRQSATILSRSKTLQKVYIDKIRARLSSYGVDPYELSIIDQQGCPNSGVNINVDDETFSSHNIGEVVRKAGDKLGEGVEYAANGAKKLYGSVSSKKDSTTHDREGIIENNENNRQVEWLP